VNKTRLDGKKGGAPAVIRFKSKLVVRNSAEGKPSKTVLDVPKAVASKLRGMATVEGTINGHPFRAPLEPASNGDFLRVNAAMLDGARAGVGDAVQLAVLGPEPEPEIPADLQAAFSSSRRAMTLWNDLTLLGRLDWIRWIESAKAPETRARRVARTVEQLSSGKRRPCCVNVYEFMLNRVAQ
jgi:hypothetical protein